MTRMNGSGREFALSVQGGGDSCVSESDLSLVNTDRLVANASGEIYPEGGISQRSSSTRLLLDKNSFGNAGNEIPYNRRVRRHGADPSKNESGRTSGYASLD